MDQWNSHSLSVVYSNLQKAAEKQQDYELMNEYATLSRKFTETDLPETSAEELLALVSEDLDRIMPGANEIVKTGGDRGAQRALKWGSTVAKIQKSILDRYIKKGDEVFENKDFYVCQACGFIFVGTEAPKICAACKAPSIRFVKIK